MSTSAPDLTLVLIHGAGSSATIWDALIAQTKRNFVATKRAFPKAGTVDLANLKTHAPQFLIQSNE